ncbi:phage tail sheath family protein [Marilutibacter maris]|uniref:phage tail sheath family protein n=1 Tax=Marilutibacter maris TaxID=1605891 RepID=UPI000DA94105|nr:phage tail sheath subtilisin-like domain-containing protein [Lysobacter maris]
MPARDASPRMQVVASTMEATLPGVYLSPRAVDAGVEPVHTGTPVFLGVRGIDRVIRLDCDERDAIVAAAAAMRGMTPYALRGFFANGGRRCYLVPADSAGTGQADVDALEAMETHAGDFDLVCAPDLAASVPADELARAHARILAWCARGGRHFAILDAPRRADDLDAYRQALAAAMRGRPGVEASFGAGYGPWLQVARGRPSQHTDAHPAVDAMPGMAVPACGHIAGVYSRNDRAAGVWSAPANEVVIGAVALDGEGADALAAVGRAGINPLRGFRKRGIRVWGARTFYDGADSGLRYVTARRTLQVVTRRLEQVLAPLVFEPDTPLLWVRVNRIVNALFENMYRSGVLAGGTPEQAYFVRCDADTNPPQVRESGQVVVEAGIAVVAPAEFITIDIRVGGNDLAIFQHVGG